MVEPPQNPGRFKNKNSPPRGEEAERIKTWIEETFSLHYDI
jgi:hypothetical protein